MRISQLACVACVTGLAMILISCGGAGVEGEWDENATVTGGLTSGSTGGSTGGSTTSTTGGSTTSTSTSGSSSSTTGSSGSSTGSSSTGGSSSSTTGSSSTGGSSSSTTGSSTGGSTDGSSTGGSTTGTTTGGSTDTTGGTTGVTTGTTTTTGTTGGTTTTTGSTTGSSSGSTDGSTGGTTDGSTGGSTDGSTGGTTGLTTGGSTTTTGGTTGLTTGGSDGSTTGGGSTGGTGGIVVPSNVTFNVIVTGQVGRTSMTDFSVNGQLHVSGGISTPGTPNGDNDRDFVLFCGNPLLNPAPGVIRLASNQELFEVVNLAALGSLLPLDCCLLSVDDILGSLEAQLSASQALQIAGNGFNASSGILATVYKPKTGSITLNFSADGQSVSGSINIQAVDLLNRTWTYSATISGTVSSG